MGLSNSMADVGATLKVYKYRYDFWYVCVVVGWDSRRKMHLCQYEDGEYPCPRDSLSVVATGYGADWRTPRRKYGPSANWTDNLYHYNNERSCHRSSHHI